MIYDGIIEKLQKVGGISIYFNELISRYKLNNNFKYIRYINEPFIEVSDDNLINRNCRFLERYRNVHLPQDIGNDEIFHSTYYRLPTKPVKVVTTVHDFTYEKFVNGAAKMIHSWQKNNAIQGSDKIICVSNNTAYDLLRFCPVDESKIAVVYNGVSKDYHVLDKKIQHGNEVVFVGARGGYKNFLSAVDAILLCPDLSLSIVGGGPLKPEEVSYLQAKIPNRYRWLGRLSNYELNEVYNRAYCLLYPSSYEGFGIPVIEAMRAGCPVIALNISSIPEVSGDAAILIDQLDVNMLADALKTLDCISQRNSYIQAGLLNSQRFSWDKCYEETNKIYQSLK
ncbi:TPA: glycosyltransferase family 4 protein [Photobacterium damselae]